ncbi:MAG TPA: hypothetical protein VGZ01_07325 [Trinickia sp.]|nr:hypothetical protein [Trinickia sp.]
MERQARDVAGMWRAIDELDLTRIKAKLLHRNRGALTSEEAERAEAGYRQFLKLAAKFPEENIVPSAEVDEFWHMHIFDTQRYGTDCERIFGHMLHHDPYGGIEGGEDEAHHFELAAASHELASREFGWDQQATAYVSASASAYSVRPSREAASAAYSVRPPMGATSAAYSVRPSVSAAYSVRPSMEAASAAYSVRPPMEASSAAYSVRPPMGVSSAAYSVRPSTTALSLA